MNKEDMVIGKEYLHCDPAFSERYVFKNYVPNKTWGNFADPVNGIDYTFSFSHMTTAKPEFNDEIEVCDFAHFKIHTGKGEFKHLNPDGTYWIVDDKGYMRSGAFARKVEPMVRIRMCIVGDNGGLSKETWDISKELADKIKAGDV
jgi:hypothetical protein